MGNTFWSTCVQGVGTLYTSRAARFADAFRDEYLRAFGLADGGKLLEIGCGPGALAAALGRWYPHAQISAVDRDSNFVAFAREVAPGVDFSEGDATALAFADGTFDATISNTVVEHVEPSSFYGEQRRVLREGGVCIVLSARKTIRVPAPCVAAETEFERELWQRTETHFRAAHESSGVGQYAQDEAALPRCMEAHGFHDVTVDYLALSLTPDDPRCSAELARTMIDANRRNDLDNAERLRHIARAAVTDAEIEEMKRRIHARYDERLALYERGIRQWDTDTSVIMVVRGVK